MKRSLLLLSVLIAGTAASQVQGKAKPAGMAEIARAKYQAVESAPNPNVTGVPLTAPINGKSSGATNLDISWNPISQSINLFGVLGAEQRLLHYDEDLDVVTFIQRKSPHYVMNPAPTTTGAISGGIIAMVTEDWGGTWDSTLVWNNSTNWARYPQGGLYKPAMVNNLAGSYAVVMGPVTTANQIWEGNYFASKQLNTFDNVASTVPLAQQFISSVTPPPDSVRKVDFANKDLSISDDGVVRTLGIIDNDINSATTNNPLGFRGARLVKGEFVSGIFKWTSDSITLFDNPVDFSPTTLDFNVVDNYLNQAWSESGQIGYVWFLGIRTASTGVSGNNIGVHPLVWKTTNSGQSWSLLPPIDFNDTQKFKVVLDRTEAVETPTATGVKIPFFNFNEDISGAVDKNGELHLVSSLWSSRSSHPDSIFVIWTYTNTVGDGETYRYAHTPGREKYIYDFTTTGGGASWGVALVDSTETELIGSQGLGSQHNPYPDTKQLVGSRIQTSRSHDGEYIIYTWADSKYLFTPNALRWNARPDIYVKVRHADSANAYPVRHDLTGFIAAGDVYTSAFMHHVSTKARLTPGSSACDFTLTLPVTVTRSNPLTADGPNTHYFAAAVMSFTNLCSGTKELGSLDGYVSLFPNPAKGEVNLKIQVDKPVNAEISVLNAVGQMVNTRNAAIAPGGDEIRLNISELPKGIYLVRIDAEGSAVTRKLVVE